MTGKRILLIIGGGIAAYKSLDLIRRLRERGAIVRCILTRAGHEFVTPLSVGALSGERAFTDLFDPQSEFDVGHIRLAARHRSRHRRARHRRPDRENGQRPCRRSGERGAARDRQAGPARAGDEPAYVVESGDATQRRTRHRGWRASHRPQCRRDGRKRRSRPWAAWRRPIEIADASDAAAVGTQNCEAACRQAHPDHVGADA